MSLGTAWLIGRSIRWCAARLALLVGTTVFGLVALLTYLYDTHVSPHPEGGSIIDSLVTRPGKMVPCSGDRCRSL